MKLLILDWPYVTVTLFILIKSLLWNDIEKMYSELRHKVDKVTTGKQVDLNLERGIIRDELSNQNVGTSNLTNKFDRDIHAWKARLEAGKYDDKILTVHRFKEAKYRAGKMHDE